MLRGEGVFPCCLFVGVLDVFVDGRIARDWENERFDLSVVDRKKRRIPAIANHELLAID